MERGEASGVVLRYRNRDLTAGDVDFLKTESARRWASRADFVRRVCEAWDWRQANGAFSLFACSDLLLRLAERGWLSLPPRRPGGRRSGSGSWGYGGLRVPPDLVALTGLEVRDPVDLASLTVRPISPEERLGWRLYVGRYHALGDRPIIGEHILYAAHLDGELVALLAWASAALRAPLREAYVGWDEPTKRRRLQFVTNNVRFLILPWVRVRHLASKLLALNLRRLRSDWQAVWKHPVWLAETFVDTTRYRGTSYRAANWIDLGQTAGRSKRGNNYLYGGSPKALFVYPLHRQARRWLRGEGPT